MDAFCGSWKLTDSEGFDEIAQRLGFNLAQRTAAKTLKPTMIIAPAGDGYSLKMSSTFKTHEIVFKLNEEFDLTTMDGRHVKSIITLEGNTLKQVDTGDKITYVDRELEGDSIKVTTRVDELVSVRHYFRA
ncbi:Lipocalin / cytosolic fatty-acid binding protein [Sparganum proliferum]